MGVFRNAERTWALLTLCLAFLNGCAPEKRRPNHVTRAGTSLTVFAEADLRDALADISTTYLVDEGDTLRLVFGSARELTAQIIDGAKGDVFLSSNAIPIDDLATRGLVIDSTRSVYALGHLALIARCATSTGDVSTSLCAKTALNDLANDTVKSIAIADPLQTPYGEAARQVLKRSNLWSRVHSKIVMGSDFSQAERLVATGDADAGLVALPLVLRTRGRTYTIVDSTLYDRLPQSAAVLTSSSRVGAAVEFLQFMRTEEAAVILRRYGFTEPPTDLTRAATR